MRGFRGDVLGIGLAFIVLLGPGAVHAQPCVDKTPPTIVITSPLRAEQLEAGGLDPLSLTVTGEVADSESAIVSILMNDVELLSGPGELDEPFSATVDSPWGLNTLVVTATDACGNEAGIVHSFIRGAASSGFYPAATADDSTAYASHGIRAWVGQALIDDGDRSDLDDLATALDDALGSLDLNTVIPTTIQVEDLPKCNFGDTWASDQAKELRITRGTITAGAFGIDSIVAKSAGLEVKGSLDSLSMPITIRAYECVAGHRDNTAFTGTFHLTNTRATIVGDATVSSGQADVTISSSTVTTDSISLSVSCGTFQSLCNSVTNDLASSLEGTIENKIENKIANKVPNVIEPFLEALDVGSVVSLPAPLDTAVTLESGLDEVEIGSGFVRIGNSTQLHPDSRGALIPAAAPGSIRRSGASAVPFTGTRDLGFSFKDDLVNQLLWSLWYGGFLDFDDLSSLIDRDGVESLALFADLPPVWMPGAAPDGATVGLGEIYIDTTIDTGKIDSVPNIGTLTLHFGVAATIEGIVSASGLLQKVGFQPQSAEVHIQLVDISVPALAGAVTPFLESFLEGLLPDLVGSFVGHLALPTIPVQSLGGTPGFALSLTHPAADRPAGKDGTRIEGDVARVPICGDGLRRGSEECDDGNRRFGDGCDASCRLEDGWACAGQPSVCELLCGNGQVDPGESCDDGGLANGDGCDATCQREPGFACSGEPSICRGLGAGVPLKRMVVKNVLPDNPVKNHFFLVAKDESIPEPLPGGAADPRCAENGGSGEGGRITIRMASGEEYAQDLPCEGWKLLGKAGAPKGFKYLDRHLGYGACKLVLLKQTKQSALLKVVCLGKGPVPLTLDLVEGTSRDPTTVQVVLGTEQFYCAEAVGELAKDGSDGKSFVAKNQPSPSTCP